MLIRGKMILDASQPPQPGWLMIAEGRIAQVGSGKLPEKPALGDEDAIICPGFIDAHMHLPQVDAIGCDGLDLIDWLNTIIFPAEAAWEDEDLAARQIRTAYRRMLHAGTLGFAGFLTSHFHGYQQCVRAGHDLPLRCFVGQAMMDRHAPTALLDQPLTRIARSERSRVTASVNPRFAVSCSDDCLEQAAKKIRDDSIVHTHLAESQRECELVRELFPHDAHYTAVYDRHGLLSKRTLLAHCVHLSQDEWQLIARRKCVVVHCPTANTFLQSGLFDLRSARDHGVRLALGSDVAAGPDFAMPRVARAMIDTAKVRRMTVDHKAPIPTPAEAWTLITRSNADALGWSDAGRIEVGAAADLLVLRPPFEPDEHFIGRLIYQWSDEWIDATIVAGEIKTSRRQAIDTTQ